MKKIREKIDNALERCAKNKWVQPLVQKLYGDMMHRMVDFELTMLGWVVVTTVVILIKIVCSFAPPNILYFSGVVDGLWVYFAARRMFHLLYSHWR